MGKTIAELRKKGTTARKTWHQIVSVTGEVNGRLQVLLAEKADLLDELESLPKPDSDSPSPSRRMTDEDPRVGKQAEIDAKDAEIETVRAEAEEDLLDLTMQTKHSGEWIEWVNNNPPRDGKKLDEDWECDVDALAVASMDWVVADGGQPVTPDDTAWLHENVDHGDKHAAAQQILRMQYGSTSIPKSLTGSRSVRTNAAG